MFHLIQFRIMDRAKAWLCVCVHICANASQLWKRVRKRISQQANGVA